MPSAPSGRIGGYGGGDRPYASSSGYGSGGFAGTCHAILIGVNEC